MTMTHAQQRTDELAASSRVVDRIRARLRELVEPRTTAETMWVRAHAGPCPTLPAPAAVDVVERTRLLTPEHRGIPVCVLCGFALREGDGQRLVPRPHVVEHPPLLEQLHDAIAGSTAGTSSGGGAVSRPTANLEALDAWTAVDQGVRFWCSVVTDRPAVGEVEVLVVDLIDRATTLDRDDARLVDQDVLRWWARARVVTTWDTPPLKPHVPCMNCDVRGKLQVRLDPLVAVCLGCGAAWDSDTIGLLGEHIRIAMGEQIPDPRPGDAPSMPSVRSDVSTC